MPSPPALVCGIVALIAVSSCEGAGAPHAETGEATPAEPVASDPPPVYVSLSVGRTGLCALDAEGHATCWSGTSPDDSWPSYPRMFEIDTGLTYQDVSVGSSSVCAVTTEGTLACRYYDEDDEDRMERVPDGGDFAGVSSGGCRSACAWTTEGDVSCWGDTEPLGDLLAYDDARTLDLGCGEACYVDVWGGLVCFGHEDFLGDDHHEANDVVQIDMHDGGEGCLRTSSRTLECWGDDDLSALPDGAWLDFSLGEGHGCALDLDGFPWCWGENGWNATDAPYRPYVDIEAFDDSTCALTAQGAIECWGLLADGYDLFPAAG